MSLLERIRPDGLLEQVRERRATSLPILVIVLLGLAAVILAMVTLWPNWRQRQALVDELGVEQNLIEYQSQVPRPDKSSLGQQVISLRQDLVEVQESFISETEADAILNQIYAYASAGNIAIDSLQALSTIGEEGEQLPQIAFRLKASGASTQLLNFVARINQASAPGVVLDKLSIVPSEGGDNSVLMMDIHFHTIPQILDPPTPAPPTEEPDVTATSTSNSEEPEVTATPTSTFDDISSTN